MDDLVTLSILAASVFFVVVSSGLLFRYRQVSKQIAVSNDLGKDLWEALEARLKKQDERVLDMMGKVDVIQLRSLVSVSSSGSISKPAVELSLPSSRKEPSQPKDKPESESQSRTIQQVTSPPAGKQPQVVDELRQKSIESRLGKQDERIVEIIGRLGSIQSRLEVNRAVKSSVATDQKSAPSRGGQSIDTKEHRAMVMLGEDVQTSVEIREKLGVSREHAARLLKGLFDRGLVIRNDSRKPFIYELTDSGRRYLSEN